MRGVEYGGRSLRPPDHKGPGKWTWLLLLKTYHEVQGAVVFYYQFPQDLQLS